MSALRLIALVVLVLSTAVVALSRIAFGVAGARGLLADGSRYEKPLAWVALVCAPLMMASLVLFVTLP